MEIALISPSSTSMSSDNKTTPLLYTKTSRMADKIRRDREDAANAIAEIEDSAEANATNMKDEIISAESRILDYKGNQVPKDLEGTGVRYCEVAKDMYVDFDYLLNAEMNAKDSVGESMYSRNNAKESSNKLSRNTNKTIKAFSTADKPVNRTNTTTPAEKNSETSNSTASSLNFGNNRLSSIRSNSQSQAYPANSTASGHVNTKNSSTLGFLNASITHSPSPTPSLIMSFRNSRSSSPSSTERQQSPQYMKNFFRNSPPVKISDKTPKSEHDSKPSNEMKSPNSFTPIPSSPINDDSEYILNNHTLSPSTYSNFSTSRIISEDDIQPSNHTFTPTPSAFTPHISKIGQIHFESSNKLNISNSGVSSINVSPLQSNTPSATNTITDGISSIIANSMHSLTTTKSINSHFNSAYNTRANSPNQRNTSSTKSWNYSTSVGSGAKYNTNNTLNNLISNAKSTSKASPIANKSPTASIATIARNPSPNNSNPISTVSSNNPSPSSSAISHPISRNVSSNLKNVSPTPSTKDRNVNAFGIPRKEYTSSPNQSITSSPNSTLDSISTRNTKLPAKYERRSDYKIDSKAINKDTLGDNVTDRDDEDEVKPNKDLSMLKNKVQTNTRSNTGSTKKSSSGTNTPVLNRQVKSSRSRSDDLKRNN